MWSIHTGIEPDIAAEMRKLRGPSIRRVLLWLLPAFVAGLLIADPFLERTFQAELQRSRSAWRTVDLPGTDWRINDLAVDSQHRAWVASRYKGVSVFDGKVWRSYSAPAELPNNDANAIAIDQHDQVWVGTEGGLAVFDGVAWRTDSLSDPGMPPMQIESIAVDGRGRVWLGTNSGLRVFDGTAWKTYVPATSGLPCPWVRSIAFDSTGRAGIGSWVTTGFGKGCGLTLFDGTTWTTWTSQDSGLRRDHVRVVGFDGSGRAWVATLDPGYFGAGSGISVYDGKGWTSYTQSNSGLPQDSIGDLAVDKQGRMWITSGYLTVYDGTKWKTFSPFNSGLASVGAGHVAADSNGWIWAVGEALDGHAMLSVLESPESDPLPASVLALRGTIFAPDVRLALPSLLLILWLAVVLHWPFALTVVVLVPGLLSLVGGGPLLQSCGAMQTGFFVTYGATIGALCGTILQRARPKAPTAYVLSWIPALAVVGAIVAIVVQLALSLDCMVLRFFL